jgi:hypothetical protein
MLRCNFVKVVSPNQKAVKRWFLPIRRLSKVLLSAGEEQKKTTKNVIKTFFITKFQQDTVGVVFEMLFVYVEQIIHTFW